jgi:hypothetical protein
MNPEHDPLPLNLLGYTRGNHLRCALREMALRSSPRPTS